MSCWLTDPDLFLYAKGTGSDDVHLWRCKKPVSSSSSSLVTPMKSDDFDYVSNVENHMELIAYLFDWEETDYKRLVKYIFQRRLLVNSQGFVIAELYKIDKDGNKMIDDANEEVPTIYIRSLDVLTLKPYIPELRSLDVLALKPYIPELRERPIPLRTVQVFEDVDGKAAVTEKDFNVTKLTARVEHLEAENSRLESKNNTLDTKVTELTTRVANLEAQNTSLESKNNTLDTSLKKLTVYITQMNALATLHIDPMKNPNFKEVWMNDLTNSTWVGISKLVHANLVEDLVFIGPQGTYTTDVDTNVRAIYWHKVKLSTNTPYEFRVVSVEDLTPNEEKARFSTTWYARRSKGKLYVMRHELLRGNK